MIPNDAKKLNSSILAEGETTGHAHRTTTGQLYDNNGSLILHLDKPDTITHEEHNHQVITPEEFQDYDVIKVKEFDPFEEEIRNVVD